MADATTTIGPDVEPSDGTGPPPSTVNDIEQRRVARLVTDRWKRGGEELAKARRHFWQNMAFFFGEQWVWWDPARSLLQALPQGWSPIGPGRARLTINRVEPNIKSVIARMMASDLEFNVDPNDSSDDLIQAARLAEKVLESCHHDDNWENVRFDELFASVMGGTSAVAVEWDASKGTQLEVDTNGRVVGTGAVALQALNVTEFCVEPGIRDYHQARWWCSGLAMSPAQAKERYGLAWLPKADAAGMLSPLQHKILSDSGKPAGTSLTLVLCCYERPNRAEPKGRYLCVINDAVVADTPWPFPFKRLNVRPFRQSQVTGQWQGWTYMNGAIPVQFAYNHARSVIAEHMKIAGNARLLAPYGAFTDEDFTNDPASILWYSPDMAGSMPQYLMPPNLPRWLSNEADVLKAELDDLMHVHATSRGEASFDRASGQALAFLAEKDDSPLGPMAREQSQGWSELAEMVLQILESKATEPRKATVRGDGGVPTHVTWTGRSLKGQTNARVPLEATQPRSKAADRQFANDAWDRKIVTDPQGWARLAGVPMDQVIDVLDANVARAHRENARMMIGLVELVEDFDDHAKHIPEHNRLRMSDGYQYADRSVREIVDMHIQMHETQAGAEYGKQVGKAQIDPGLAKLPQGAAPIGSVMPPPWAQSQSMDPALAAQMGGMPADPTMSAGPIAQALAGAPPMMPQGG